MFRRFSLSICLLSLLAAFIFLGAWFNFILTPLVTEPTGLRYQLRPGSTLKTLSEDLTKQGLVKQPSFFKLLAYIHGSVHELKAGVYLIPQGTTPGRLLTQLTSGSGLLYRVFTIIPGWTFQQLRVALEQQATLHSTLQTMSDAEVLKQLGASPGSAEGAFFPDSYYYIEGSTDLQLLSRAYKRMQMKFQEVWQRRDPQAYFKTPSEALIAASLVEKETSLSSERPVIAGVIINRLQKKMLLQIDPTVVYGLYQWELTHKGAQLGFSGLLRKQDLKMDTPYNTYLHRGLPPTPIAMPSLDSLTAVLHPVQHPYLYFVATGSGGHQFSATLNEHHLAVLLLHFHEQGFFNYFLIQSYILKRLSFASLLPLNLEGQTNVLQ